MGHILDRSDQAIPDLDQVQLPFANAGIMARRDSAVMADSVPVRMTDAPAGARDGCPPWPEDCPAWLRSRSSERSRQLAASLDRSQPPVPARRAPSSYGRYPLSERLTRVRTSMTGSIRHRAGDTRDTPIRLDRLASPRDVEKQIDEGLNHRENAIAVLDLHPADARAARKTARERTEDVCLDSRPPPSTDGACFSEREHPACVT
jgi:hypothetical protein